MAKESEFSIVLRSVENWPIGVSKNATDMDQEYPEIRGNVSHSSRTQTFVKANCFDVQRPAGRGAYSQNLVTRTSLPGNICGDCYFNGKSKTTCSLMKS